VDVPSFTGRSINDLIMEISNTSGDFAGAIMRIVEIVDGVK